MWSSSRSEAVRFARTYLLIPGTLVTVLLLLTVLAGVSDAAPKSAPPKAPLITTGCGSGGTGTIVASGTTLSPGDTYYSPNCSYWLSMQTDGNLVFYYSGGALWSSQTNGQSGDYAVMQGDGNLAVYSGGQWQWQAGTFDYNGAYLDVQNDGNLVIYTTNGSPIWAYSWTGSSSGSQGYSQLLFLHYGWNVSQQYPYLNDLWNQESNWRWYVCGGYPQGPYYPSCPYSSGPYGIPQASPGSKMACVTGCTYGAAGGANWTTDGLTQVQWGLNYIAGRYGNPQTAWDDDVACGYCGYAPTA